MKHDDRNQSGRSGRTRSCAISERRVWRTTPFSPAASLHQTIDHVHYEVPVRLAGFVPDDIDSTLARGFHWAHNRGNDLESLQEVRRAAGAISDEDFKRLYERYTEYTSGQDSYSTFDWESWEYETKAAYRRGSGKVSDDYLPDAGTSSEGYMGGLAFEGHLTRYAEEEGLSQNEIAKRIRGDENLPGARQRGRVVGGRGVIQERSAEHLRQAAQGLW